MTARTCTGPCGRTLPWTREFFHGHSAGRLKKICIECCNRKTRERRAAMTPEEREAIKRVERLKQRERRARDPERANEAARRSRRKARANAEKRKREREMARMRGRLRAERKGRSMDEMEAREERMKNSREDRGGMFPKLPSRPLALVIDAIDARRRRELFAGARWLGPFTAPEVYVSEAEALLGGKPGAASRMVYAWRVGERVEVQFDTADAVLTAADLCWWEVYNPETVRRPILTVAVRRPRSEKARVQTPRAVLAEDGWRVRFSGFSTAERRSYGDRGPDWETLAEIEHTFCCEGLAHCWICWAHQGRERARKQGEQMVLAEAA